MSILAVCFASLSLYASVMAGGEPAREEHLLIWLEGEWAFALGDYHGVRKIRIIYPDHLLAFEEVFDGDKIQGQGYIGYSPLQNMFYEFSAHNPSGEVAFMTGILDQRKDVIVYRPEEANGELKYEVEWEKISDDAFSYTAYDIGARGSRTLKWTAKFTRQGTPMRVR